MNELGILMEVNENDNIAFYHIHTMKTDEQHKWNVGEIMNTEDFSRPSSYNPPKDSEKELLKKSEKKNSIIYQAG